jgi:hypothetical protein
VLFQAWSGVIVTAKEKGSKRCLFVTNPAMCLRGSFGAVLLTEFINTAGGVDNFLCASVERMAFRTNFNAQGWFGNHGLGLKAIATAASHGEFLVIWVYICFHFIFLGVILCGWCTHFRARIIHKKSGLRKF